MKGDKIMSQGLRIDYEGVNACVTKMNESIEDLEDAAGKIDSTVMEELGQHWEGESYNKCIETYTDNYQQLLSQKIPEMVGELKKFMEDCKTYLEQTDAQLAGQ